jgi:phosphoserine phosphatase
MNDDIPLCVDLDGTLVRSDLLVESFFQLLRVNILCLVRVPLWLVRGKACLKDQIAQRVELHVDRLPYDDEFIAYLKSEADTGQKLVLVTATHEKYACAIADYLGIFDDVIATRHGCNVAGEVKRDLLVERYGEEGFDYAGNSRADGLTASPVAIRSITFSISSNWPQAQK